MKKRDYEKRDSRLASLDAKCDLIIELLESVLDNPDFLIDRLRRSVEHQHRSVLHPTIKVVRYHEPE